jgi:hypothetical protein
MHIRTDKGPPFPFFTRMDLNGPFLFIGNFEQVAQFHIKGREGPHDPMSRFGRNVAICGKRNNNKAQAMRLSRKGNTPL